MAKEKENKMILKQKYEIEIEHADNGFIIRAGRFCYPADEILCRRTVEEVCQDVKRIISKWELRRTENGKK